MPAQTKRWTAQEVRDLADESRHWPRYELIGGELFVTPAPRPVHQHACALLWSALRDYVRSAGVGEVYASPADIELEPGTIVQPDVFVTPRVGGRRPREWSEVAALTLAVEVVSPSSARADRVVKRAFFARMGVPEYWVVDLDARVVERWRPADERPEIATGALAWQPADAPEPLSLDLDAYFRDVHDEQDEPDAAGGATA
ncbi:MAG: Uma2 family endonuclease [Gemmatimonadaceae bacterium]